MLHELDDSKLAASIADPARAAMLNALRDGRAMPAGELAFAAGLSPATGSPHLDLLLDQGLVSVETEGRHRYYRLTGSHVVRALDRLAPIDPAAPVRRKALSPQALKLRYARCCYGHLAGQLGVAVTNALRERCCIVARADKVFEITADGAAWFAGIGLDITAIEPSCRGLACQCLDWTERSHHLAGPLGVQLLRTLCDAGWLQRTPGTRAVHVTPKGQSALERHVGIDARALRMQDSRMLGGASIHVSVDQAAIEA